MTGGYTKVALRDDERWESAPAQEGRALLDHEVNLNPAAALRRDRHLAGDAIGTAGVVLGSGAFQIGVSPGPLDLIVDAGRMWVGGLAALAPAAFTYGEQDQMPALPVSGRALVYLDVWEEHLQPVEDPSLVDPALAGIDTASRTRVGYRVRVSPTTATTCSAAWSGFDPAQLSTGRLTASRVGPAAPADACDPPGDSQGLVPDGLLRIEVLDQGSAAGARFAWSYDNGSAAVGIAGFAAATVTLQPSPAVRFGADLVEVSWLARRADRLNAGSLYQVTSVTPSAAGDVLTLDRNVAAPPGAEGLVLRRWEGQVIGAAADQNASRNGNDLGIRFRVTPGTYRPGDWWGVRVREADGVQPLNDAPPDGARHFFAPLALVDLDTRAVLEDCRRTFRPLTDIQLRSPCTVVAQPGDDLQGGVDSLPPGGGEVCLSAGTFTLAAPLVVAGRNRVRITGVGPATVVRVTGSETVILFENSDDVELQDLSLESDSRGAPPGDEGLDGAATFAGCRGVTVRSVHVTAPDGTARVQTAITVRSAGNRRPERVRISGCDLVVGAWQTGILVTEGRDVVIDDNHLVLGPAPAQAGVLPGRGVLVAVLARLLVASLSPQATSGTRTLRLPTNRTVHLVTRSPVAPLVEEWVRLGDTGPGGEARAFARFALTLTADGGTRLTPPARNAFTTLVRTLRSVGQGIVVGGSRASTVRITGNVIRDALQGVHVGASSAGAGRDDVEEVLIGGNTMHLVVPAAFARERHAVFVGNARSIQVTDTRATLVRPASTEGVAETAVDGIRLVGFFGPYVAVRGASLTGFDVGVRARPEGAAPTSRVWSVAEVMASGRVGAVAVSAPVTFARSQVAP